MGIIDADTHIDETDATWEYMAGGDSPYKPTTAYPSNPDPKLPPARYWVIDGKRQIRFIRSDKDSGTTVETRELLDVKARLKHMDELGTDTQVIYPTLFLMEATEKPEINAAMRRSYNRWLGDRCSQSGGQTALGLHAAAAEYGRVSGGDPLVQRPWRLRRLEKRRSRSG